MRRVNFWSSAILLVALAASNTATAQLSAVRKIFSKTRDQRNEIILPKVNG